MTTNCLIGLKGENRTARVIYCHFDGYPKYVGMMLHKHYRDVKKLNKLLALGDISCLAERVSATKEELENRVYDTNSVVSNVVVAYARDRGEKKNPARWIKLDGEIYEGVDYVYIYDANRDIWEVYKAKTSYEAYKGKNWCTRLERIPMDRKTLEKYYRDFQKGIR